MNALTDSDTAEAFRKLRDDPSISQCGQVRAWTH